MNANTARFIESFECISPDVPEEPSQHVRLVQPRGQPRIRVRRYHLTDLEVALDGAMRRARTGYWEDAKSSVLVGLYAFCHKLVYGIVPIELDQGREFIIATRLAKKLHHEAFADDTQRMVEFIRWSWEREKRVHAWAQSKMILDRRPMSYKAQFSRAKQTEYRVALTQQKRF